MKYVAKYVCVLMIDVCINSRKSHMADFIGCFFMYECVRVYLCMYSCMGL